MERWRAEGKAIYRDDRLVGLLTHEEFAQEVVTAANGAAKNDRENISRAISREANRVWHTQERDYPSNVLDAVAYNILAGLDDHLSMKAHPSGKGLLPAEKEKT